jgi:phosphotransferase system HPr (HPr) family protein
MGPAAEVSKIAAEFDAIVALYKGNRIAHAHSLVELLMLDAFHGDELKVCAIGNDAEEALAAIANYFKNYTDDQTPRDIDSEAA